MAVSKQTQVNTFNDGMQKDLNPLLTPNTVMSDCLNGTILTYNGNEFALQNDLGNYKMKYGSLDPGFVPIGIKEHANVLYIISYNPISDEVEIGSFPSMKTVNESSINRNGNGVENDITLNNGVNLYTELTGKCSLTLLSELNDDFKLNPGDGYILDLPDDNNNDYLWKYLATYVFTDNSKLYNIDDYIQLSNISDSATVLQSEFKNVTWDVPGWLAIKPSVNVMEEFSAYVDEVEQKYVDNNPLKNVWIDLHTTWEGKRFSTEVKNNSEDDYIIDAIHKNLFYKYKTSPTEIENSWSEEGWNNYYTGNITKQYSDINFTIHNTLYLEEVQDSYIAIVPCLKVGDKTIVYDQFLTTFKLEEKPFDPSILVVADQLFKYSWDKNHPGYMKFRFDCLNAENSELHYNFISYATGNRIGSWKQIDGLEPSSVTLSLNIPFGDDFDKEDLYDLEILFTPEGYNITEDPENDNKCAYFRFKVYASEIMNYWSDKCDNFTDLDDSDFVEAMSVLSIDANFKDGVTYSAIHNSIDNTYKNSLDESFNVENSIKQELSKINFSNDFSEESIIVSEGTRYMSDKIIKWPLNNKKEIGAFWKNLSVIDVNGVAYSDDNLEFKILSKSIDGNVRAFLDIESSNKINISSDVFSKGLSNVQPICLNNKTISIEDDGWMKLNTIYVFTKKDPSARQGYKYGKINISSELDFRFKVNNNFDTDGKWLMKIKTKSLLKNYQDEFDITYEGDQFYCVGDDEKQSRMRKLLEIFSKMDSNYFNIPIINILGISAFGWDFYTIKSEKDGSNETASDDKYTQHSSQDFSKYLSGINYVIYSGSRRNDSSNHVWISVNGQQEAGWGRNWKEGDKEINWYEFHPIKEVLAYGNDLRFASFMCLSGGEENYTFSFVRESIFDSKEKIDWYKESLLRYLLLSYSCRVSLSDKDVEFYYNRLTPNINIVDNVNISRTSLELSLLKDDKIPTYINNLFKNNLKISSDTDTVFNIENINKNDVYYSAIEEMNDYLKKVYDNYQDLPGDGPFVFKLPEMLIGNSVTDSLESIIKNTIVENDKICVYGQQDPNNYIKIRNAVSDDRCTKVANVVTYE